jgi:polyphenol oxidase
MTIIPTLFKQFENLFAGQSTRLGGVSEFPYTSLNLGKSVGDDIKNVDENRQIFFKSLGFESGQAVLSHQIHGVEILQVFEPGNYEGFDAQITNIPNICLAVSIADCTPILIYDAENKAIAAIHAGWKGTVGHIITKTLNLMNTNYGTIGKHCFAYIGACISTQNFEVNTDVADHFKEEFRRFDETKNKYFVDLKSANKAQLVAFGVPEGQIEVSEHCTVTNNDLYFSHRKENGKTGRMLAAIGMK